MSLLDDFSSRRLLVLGDVILDRYWWGDSTRLSPEAPVPIVRLERSTVRAGGAANTAANLVSLGAKAELLGTIGCDRAGAELRKVTAECGVVPFLIEDASRPTTSKTRIIALHQQVVRVDEEATTPIPDAIAVEAIRRVRESLTCCQGMILSDYGKGFLSPQVTRHAIGEAHKRGIPAFVDPKGVSYEPYAGCSLLKPNRIELGVLTHRVIRNHQDTLEAGRQLRAWMPGTSILVTEGADGMTLFSADGSEEHADSILKQVFDVTGAGDTVLATVALAMISGAAPREALDLASRAASIVVGVIGTATVTREQLS
jgi:rfaE bifunctional protein kinase chain/domain